MSVSHSTPHLTQISSLEVSLQDLKQIIVAGNNIWKIWAVVDQSLLKFIQFSHNIYGYMSLCCLVKEYFLFAICGFFSWFYRSNVLVMTNILSCGCFPFLRSGDEYCVTCTPKKPRQDFSNWLFRVWSICRFFAQFQSLCRLSIKFKSVEWYRWIRVLFIITNRRKRRLWLQWNSSKPHSKSKTRCCFWSIVTKRGNHLTRNFFIRKCLWKIFLTHSVGIFMMAKISHTFMFRHSKQ